MKYMCDVYGWIYVPVFNLPANYQQVKNGIILPKYQLVNIIQ